MDESKGCKKVKGKKIKEKEQKKTLTLCIVQYLTLHPHPSLVAFGAVKDWKREGKKSQLLMPGLAAVIKY